MSNHKLNNAELFEAGLRRCALCKEVLPLDDFHMDKTRCKGYASKCKECMKAYYESNRETLINRAARWNKDNREKYNASQRQRYYKKRSKDASN